MASNPFTDLEQKLDYLTRMVCELRTELKKPVQAQDKPLSIDEAADYTSIKKSTLYGFTSSRQIPHFKRGKRVLFYKSELDNWLKANKQKTVEEIEAEA